MPDFWSQQRDAKAKAKEQDFSAWMQTRTDLLNTFGSESGRRVLWNMLERGHFFRSTYTGNSLGMFMEGERNFVCWLQDYVSDLIGDVVAQNTSDEMHERIKQLSAKD